MHVSRFLVPVTIAVALGPCGSSSKTSSNTSAATSGTSAASATTASSAELTDACTLVTLDEVAAVTKATLTADPAGGTATNCSYISATSGLFFFVAVGTLTTGDQASFDTAVKGQEASSTITPINGIGDGDGALVTHQDNVTAYGFVGKKTVAVTVFNGASDPAANAQELLKTALSRV